jgi:hypothetical protein
MGPLRFEAAREEKASAFQSFTSFLSRASIFQNAAHTFWCWWLGYSACGCCTNSFTCNNFCSVRCRLGPDLLTWSTWIMAKMVILGQHSGN